MHVRQRLGASERHACHVLGQPRSTQRRVKKLPGDEEALRTDVIRLASRFGRYGYRQITNLLRIEGWAVNHKRVERIWRQEGLKVPRRQPKRGRLWLNDGSCIRLRPLHKNHVLRLNASTPPTAMIAAEEADCHRRLLIGHGGVHGVAVGERVGESGGDLGLGGGGLFQVLRHRVVLAGSGRTEGVLGVGHVSGVSVIPLGAFGP